MRFSRPPDKTADKSDQQNTCPSRRGSRAAFDAAVAAKNAAAEGVHQAEARLVQALESVARTQAQMVQSQGKVLSAHAASMEPSSAGRQVGPEPHPAERNRHNPFCGAHAHG